MLDVLSLLIQVLDVLSLLIQVLDVLSLLISILIVSILIVSILIVSTTLIWRQHFQCHDLPTSLSTWVTASRQLVNQPSRPYLAGLARPQKSCEILEVFIP